MKRLEDPDWLREQYHNNGLSSPEIAELLGCCSRTVRRYMEKFGIPRNRFPTIKDPIWLQEQCDNGLVPEQIAKLVGCSSSLIYENMKRLGIHPVSTSKLLEDPDPDPDWLREQYWDKGLTVKQIAELLECCKQTVYDYMERFDTLRRNGEKMNHIARRLRLLLKEGVCEERALDFIKLVGDSWTGFNMVYGGYKRSARYRGLVFDISREDAYALMQADCFYCGLPPTNRRGYNGCTFIFNGLDRYDNENGYIIDNLVSCCTECNYVKKARTADVFLAHCRRVFLYQRMLETGK